MSTTHTDGRTGIETTIVRTATGKRGTLTVENDTAGIDIDGENRQVRLDELADLLRSGQYYVPDRAAWERILEGGGK